MRVLIADDDPVCRAMLKSTLEKWGYDVEAYTDGVQAWKALRSNDSPTLAIIDWLMPGLDGVQLCQKVRQQGQGPCIYMILLTSRREKEDVTKGLDAGADDYLIKPFDARDLQTRVRAAQKILSLQEIIRRQAAYDSVTGIWNHAALLGIVQQELARAKHFHQTVGLVMAEIKNLKSILAAYNSSVGEAVLREIADHIRACIQVYDGLGRYDGNKFLIFLPGATLENAMSAAEKIYKRINSTPLVISQTKVFVTMGFGVAISEAEGKLDRDTLLQALDSALGRIKGSGGAYIESATYEPNQSVTTV